MLTGDVGRLDENGYLYLVDRKKDTIVSGGFNIYPGELENAIASHPAVIEVAVFGIPHEKWGETPMAVCAVTPGESITEEEIIGLVTDRLGSYMKPTKVELRTDLLPRSPTGKIMRRALREPYWSGTKRASRAPDLTRGPLRPDHDPAWRVTLVAQHPQGVVHVLQADDV